jgi:vacuolar iron transporter family protein
VSFHSTLHGRWSISSRLSGSRLRLIRPPRIRLPTPRHGGLSRAGAAADRRANCGLTCVPRPPPREQHLTGRIGWLRAAVLGANDGLVSVGSLVLGVSAARASHGSVLIAGVSAWLAGAMSMAAGEYVSVSSQADTQQADIDLERRELQSHPRQEHRELAAIYVKRGLSRDLADQVAGQLMEHNALEAHARDEIGISRATAAQPLQAALTSALTFTLGVIPPLTAIWLAPPALLLPVVIIAVLAFLTVLGALGAWAGGASIRTGALRVVVWGGLALAVTGAVGAALGLAR